MREHERQVAVRPGTDLVEAFSEFYREFVAKLVGFLVVQGARPVDAADVAQDTMREIYLRWPDIENPKAYARITAARAWGRRMATVQEDLMEEPGPLVRSRSAIDEWEQRQETLRLLALLPLRQRQVMAWTFEGHEPSEIAAMLTISPGAVRSSLNKARRALAALVDDAEGTP